MKTMPIKKTMICTQLMRIVFQITESYAFLPREAVTKFLLSCSDCQRRPCSPAIKRPLSLKPVLNTPVKRSKIDTDISDLSSANDHSGQSEQNSPENLCKHDRAFSRHAFIHSTPLMSDTNSQKLPDISSGSDKEIPQAFHETPRNTPPSTDTSDSSFENLTARKPLMPRKGIFERNEIYKAGQKRFPICYPIPQRDGRKKLAVEELFAHDLRKTESVDDPVRFIW